MLTFLKRLIKKPFTPLNLITISRNRLVQNYQNLSRLNPKVSIAPVLKSNAYGHGIRLVGEILDQVGAPFLCVDSLYEAFQLKSKSSVKTPILIMGYIHPKSLSVKKLPFSFAVYDLEHAQILNEYQKGSKIHIVGLISMNIITIDITAVKDPVLDQEVVIISDNPEDPNSIANLSETGGILPHEMLIHIAESTKRVVI